MNTQDYKCYPLSFFNIAQTKGKFGLSALAIILWFPPTVLAQNTSKPIQTKATSVELVRDSRIDTLVKYMFRINDGPITVPGYRVQIYFGSERAKANEIKVRFLTEFPDEYAYTSYQQPNFKVRVGDFRTRSEASQFMSILKHRYPVSFIVNDMVTLRKHSLNEEF